MVAGQTTTPRRVGRRSEPKDLSERAVVTPQQRRQSLGRLQVNSLFFLKEADMAAFAKYDGVDGESKDANHDKWIDVLSIDWGSHKPGGGATGP